jgi:acetylornithine deacetylase
MLIDMEDRVNSAVEILDRLIAFESLPGQSNLDLIAYIRDYLAAADVESYLSLDDTGTRANLHAWIGPAVDGGVVLNGHTDVVPVDGQAWTSDPFQLTRRDGRLYGRGTTDMKGFLAVVLAALPELVAADLQRPIILVLTYDEEIGTVGAPSAVASLLATQPRPEIVIVGEPTSMEVVNAHKGVRAWTTTVEGLDGHSSQPQYAANAVAALARIATYIDDLATLHRERAADPRFTPPYTTFNLATVHGGQAINIIPRRAELTWEYRPVPADDSDALRDEVERFARAEVLPRLRAATGVGEITFRSDAAAKGLDAEVNGPAERLVRELTGYDGPGRTVPFGTDGGHFQVAGLSTVVCGPGSIDQAHQPDEWIEVAQLDACAGFVDRLLAHLTDS